MKLTSVYTSYLVRIWQEEQAGGEGEPPAWQGEVTHIQSGHKAIFQEMDQLLLYLLEHLDREDQFEG